MKLFGTRRIRPVGMLLGVAAGLALPGFVLAQEPVALEEIVVTATKREASIQDVPLTITAVTGDTLAALDIKRFDDLEMPAVSIGQGGANDALFIRGVGSGFNQGFDQAAPLFSDGTWFGQANSQRLAFLDIERIEILKGPQPTYLGKNAIAGAISVVSKRPTDELSGALDASYEFEAEERSVFGVLSGPVVGGLKARVAIKSSEMQGYMNNLGTNEDNPARKDLAGRVGLLYELSDSIDFYGKYEHAEYDEDSRATQLFGCLPTAPIDPTVEDCTFDRNRAVRFDPNGPWGGDGFFNYTHGIPEYQRLELDNGQIQANWRPELATVTSVTSYYQQNNEVFSKPDHNVLQRNAQEGAQVSRLFSQELRATSSGDGDLQWMVGAYYDKQHLDSRALVVLAAMGGMATDSGFNQDATTRSAFGEISYRFAGELTAKAGLRHTEVEKEADAFGTNYIVTATTVTAMGPIFAFPLNFSREDSSTDPALTLEWRPAKGRMLYASWREGFKAGGIDVDLNGTQPDDFLFEPESVTYYEAGGKFDLLNGAARFNVAVFRGEYDNLQVTQLDVETQLFRTLNAAGVTSQGVEIDTAWAANDWLTLSGAVTYLDSTYDDFPGAQCWQNPAQTTAQGCVQIGTGPGGVPVLGQNLAGKHTSFAPELSGTVSADFKVPLGFSWFGTPVQFLGQLNVFYTDEFNTNFDADPRTAQGSYYKIDARLGLGADDGTWRASLIGRNLNDELTSHWIANAPAAGQAKFAQTDRPREVAVQFSYHF